ncbi:hypothetical protein VP01_1951g5 [Puccinia sorghi]|uniref:Retrovirus-related Pol polyprotein from transposon TNT 1-94-like beta-barrel domain-containing protein n=1 Tax=Puccinia sorghi TaxID=27349 RepID=A0A0L6VC81_9BASI|nr:hypothetical protein VP01_1951g5 [Puccinia sorghi]
MADANRQNAQPAAVRPPQADGFRQAMLKTTLETIPQLTEENYPIWKDKMEALLELRGLLTTLNSDARALFADDNAELELLLISKMDSVTHNNVVTSDNRDSAKALWKSIKERFASSQSSNRARVFNNFLYLVFKEDNIEQFVTETKIAIKKLVDYNNEAKAEKKEESTTTDASLYSNKDKRKNNPKFGKNKNSTRSPDWWKEEQAKWKASKLEANYFMSLLTLWVEKEDNKSRIIMDSGASAHIFNDGQFFTQITQGEFDNIKTGKEDATLPIKGKGTVRMKWGNRVIQLEDCLYVPDIVINLVSAGSLDKKGCQIHSKAGKFLLRNPGKGFI